jgi:Cytochrome b5-like Heme/Steroid binding domain
MIRLGALRTAGRVLREWCRILPPLVVLLMASTSHGYSAMPLALLWTMIGTVGWHWLNRERQDSLGLSSLLISPLARTFPQDAKSDRLSSETGPPCDRLTTWEIPTSVLASICCYLHPRDVVQLTCLNKSAVCQYASDIIWKQLWYRDYGNVLLQWHVGREALNKSLKLHDPTSTSTQQSPTSFGHNNLEPRLSQCLDQLGQYRGGLRDFYFCFGETYLHYLLAGRNDVNRQDCFLGLHGHILDFAPFASYHPGLIEPVLRECGQDATVHFESLPHSRGARSVARKLVVVANRGCFSNNSCGLELQSPPSQLQTMLRTSNSRPLQENTKLFFPAQPNSPLKRPSTLARIRTEWDWIKKEQELATVQKHRFWRPPFAQDESWRTYYDPISQEWIEWNVVAASSS